MALLKPPRPRHGVACFVPSKPEASRPLNDMTFGSHGTNSNVIHGSSRPMPMWRAFGRSRSSTILRADVFFSKRPHTCVLPLVPRCLSGNFSGRGINGSRSPGPALRPDIGESRISPSGGNKSRSAVPVTRRALLALAPRRTLSAVCCGPGPDPNATAAWKVFQEHAAFRC